MQDTENAEDTSKSNNLPVPQSEQLLNKQKAVKVIVEAGG